MINGFRILLLACVPALLGGCVGYNRVGAFTTDNLGISLESSTPNPQIDISYGRQEGAVEPVFEDGSTPAVAASVQHDDRSVGANIKSIFSTGNAAISTTGGEPAANDAVACVSTPITPITVLGTPVSLYKPNEVAPLFFGTDTVIGLKASVSTGNSPNVISGKLGYNRQEVAFAPVFQGNDPKVSGNSNDPGGACSHADLVRQAEAARVAAQSDLSNAQGPDRLQKQIAADAAEAYSNAVKGDTTYAKVPIYVPSTFASASDSVGATADGATASGTLKVAQVFATGKAAELVAKEQAKGAIAAVARSISPPDNK